MPKCIYLGKSTVDRMLLEIFGNHNRRAKALVGRDFAPGTIQRYETSLKHTREFLLCKYRLEDIVVQKVNHGLLPRMSLNAESLDTFPEICFPEICALDSQSQIAGDLSELFNKQI